MATSPLLSLPAKPTSLLCPDPQRVLAYAITLVALAAGCLVPIHLVGVLNLLFGHPAITPVSVLLSSLVGMCLAAFLVHRFGRMEGSEFVPHGGARRSLNVKLVIALAAVPYAVFFLIGLFSFPNGIDPLAYHIDIALKWLQAGTLSVNPALDWHYSMPSNGELPALIALSAGMPGAVAIGNLFAAILLAISVYLIAWKMTRHTSSSLLAAVLVVTIPMVTFQAFELFVDMFGTAFLMAAIAFLIWRDKRPLLLSFLGGCAAGIAIGSKPIFWIYGAVFGLASLATILGAKRQRVKSLLLMAAGIVLLSGFWFFRSMEATGNPVYPMRVSIGQHEIFRGYDSAAYTSDGFGSFREVLTMPWLDPPLLPGLRASLPSSVSGAGPLFAAIAVPGFLFLLVQIVRRRASLMEGALLLATLAAFVLWDTALLRVLRFGLPVLILFCTLAAPMIQALLVHSRRMTIGLFVAGVLLNSLFCLAEPVQRLAHRIHGHDWSRATYYGYPPLIDRLPPGSRILDRAGWGTTFMLAGVGLRNHVLPEGDFRSADYVAKTGPGDADDAALTSMGATLIYDATPRSLYTGLALPWRIYRVR